MSSQEVAMSMSSVSASQSKRAQQIERGKPGKLGKKPEANRSDVGLKRCDLRE